MFVAKYMKTRNEQIFEAAHLESGYSKLSSEHLAFEKGAQWADAHPQQLKIDENDKVEVVLTHNGALVLNEYFRQLGSFTGSSSSFKTDYVEGQRYSSELWNIMYIFYGPDRPHGTEKMFKEINILK